jgi:hypothetical protein
MENVNTIGLFGTCDNIKWRDPFMAKYAELGIPYFNPMVDDWHPGMVALEADPLAQDPIILFPVLKESYGLGSLSEIGFGPLKAVRQNRYRSFVILIDDDVTEELRAADAARAKDSKRSRALVKGHLKGLNYNNVYMVDTLDRMLETSLILHRIHQDLDLLQAQRA